MLYSLPAFPVHEPSVKAKITKLFQYQLQNPSTFDIANKLQVSSREVTRTWSLFDKVLNQGSTEVGHESY